MRPIDPDKFARLADDLRAAEEIMSQSSAVIGRARRWHEAASELLVQRKEALRAYAEASAGTRLWP